MASKTPYWNQIRTTSKKIIAPDQITKYSDLKFQNTAFESLRIEENEENKTHIVENYHYSKVPTTKLSNPQIISISEPVCNLFDLSRESFDGHEDYLIGNLNPPTSKPIAHCYVGYQFGNLAGQLGDGRAITIGDVKNKNGELWELQFKGAGKTPYSRFADGRAVLRSSIREFLASEYVHALGIPTTRALSLAVSPDTVNRDPTYNGNNIKEKCAVVIRVAPNFIRFGSFQTNLKQNGYDNKLLSELLDHVITNYHPNLLESVDSVSEAYVPFLKNLIDETARMIALWQCAGFCHGVMNTDNMSIMGQTIDYGPFGFMAHFDKFHICNTSDEWGRYAYSQQPSIGKWNIIKLLDSLKLILTEEQVDQVNDTIQDWDSSFDKHFFDKMAKKLGFSSSNPDLKTLTVQLLDTMDFCRTEMTHLFLKLEDFDVASDIQIFAEELKNLSPDHASWISTFEPKIEPGQLKSIMETKQKQMSIMMQLGHFPSEFFQDQLSKANVYAEYYKTGQEAFEKEITERWVEWLKFYQDQLRISQEANQQARETREELMKQNNPSFCLRNDILQESIKLAELGDYSAVNELLEISLDPFNRSLPEKYPQYFGMPPKWASNICLSCSS